MIDTEIQPCSCQINKHLPLKTKLINEYYDFMGCEFKCVSDTTPLRLINERSAWKMCLRVCWRTTQYFFWWSDKVSRAGGHRHDLKMTDYMLFLAVESCYNLHVLHLYQTGWELNYKSGFNDTVMCSFVNSHIFSCCVAEHKDSIKLAESFLTVHSAFPNYWLLLVPDKNHLP